MPNKTEKQEDVKPVTATCRGCSLQPPVLKSCFYGKHTTLLGRRHIVLNETHYNVTVVLLLKKYNAAILQDVV